MPALEPGLRVTGHPVNDFGRVEWGRVSVRDLVSDLAFATFARTLLSLLAREYASLESVKLQYGSLKLTFLPRDAMRKRGLCCQPVSVRLSRWWIV